MGLLRCPDALLMSCKATRRSATAIRTRARFSSPSSRKPSRVCRLFDCAMR